MQENQTNEMYYCKKSFLKRYSVCGSNKCPNITQAETSYRCQLG